MFLTQSYNSKTNEGRHGKSFSVSAGFKVSMLSQQMVNLVLKYRVGKYII